MTFCLGMKSKMVSRYADTGNDRRGNASWLAVSIHLRTTFDVSHDIRLRSVRDKVTISTRLLGIAIRRSINCLKPPTFGSDSSRGRRG